MGMKRRRRGKWRKEIEKNEEKRRGRPGLISDKKKTGDYYFKFPRSSDSASCAFPSSGGAIALRTCTTILLFT